ncbi:oxygen-independent coproporphyrinogen III oxidase [Falsiroseomonas selenitidurans]|uniref:Coproporphyrinogen-III oxidase n=1 Tax=Falsiroseomonas selenitidurans TaxID=2716335 RepID=A0ABX1DY57_9PROT|nr:oxygen-independent coproporphyrinogen III oxidase [Falsiroseomonas selenitidurans]NKC29746.1 oxygen-independent coproporphyrinogen III oxidase [Falsiroseomonas selenitidurans]
MQTTTLDTTRLALAERSVPRYTSYPTAPHFHPGVDGATLGQWLAALDPAASLSLYLHVPYCAAMCAYCGCHTKVTRQQAPLDAYAESLVAEIALLARATPARRVTHLHWGGGTPSLLGETNLARVMEALARHFDLSGLAEHAMELDPRSLTRSLAVALAGLGVNRASLGVQDFNPAVQRAIGRIQPFEVVEAGVGHLRGNGIAALNFDLIHGLPHQGLEGLARSIRLSHSLQPDRIALFGYAHVPWMKKHQRLIEESALPGVAERLDQARMAREMLALLGYEAVGLDHFTRPEDPLAQAARNGTLRRNFQGYTTDSADALLGLGASSIGRLPQGHVQNLAETGAWRRAVAEGRLPVARGLALSEDDKRRGTVIERLMCDFTVAPPADLLEAARPALRPLEEAGILRLEATRLTMTEEGRPFLRLAAAAFDAHLSHAGRHSVAV